MEKKNIGKEKQWGVVILSILSLVLGIAMIACGIFSLITDSNSIFENIRLLASFDLAAASVTAVILSIPFFFIGLGLWFLRGWAKTMLTALAAMGIIYFVLSGLLLASSVSGEKEASSSEKVGSIITALGILFSIFIIWYFTRQSLILTFEAKEMNLTRRRIRALEEKIELGRQRCNAGEISKAELSKLRSDCLAEERLLRAKIRHFEKLRLSRERKIKEKKEGKIKALEEREAKREKKRAEKEEQEEEAEKEPYKKGDEEEMKEAKETEGEKVKKKPKKKIPKEGKPPEGEGEAKKTEEKEPKKKAQEEGEIKKKVKKEKAEEGKKPKEEVKKKKVKKEAES